MGTLGEKRGRVLNTRGGSMVQVIFLVALLSIFSCGYMAMSGYNMKSAAQTKGYLEAQVKAKIIHTTFCESVAGGNSAAMDWLGEVFEEDVRLAREEYDRMVEEAAAENAEENAAENAAENAEENAESAGNAGAETAVDSRQNGGNGAGNGATGEEAFEGYLRQALGHKEYAVSGSSVGREGEDLQVEITLKAEPLEETAHVHTRVRYKGYRFSMKADIVFDNSDRGVMREERGGSRSTSESAVYLEGNGVYRYYEDEDYGGL